MRSDIVRDGRAGRRRGGGRGQGRGRGRLCLGTLALLGRLPLPFLFLHTLARGHQHAVGVRFHTLDLLLNAVHDIADALTVFRQVAIEAGELRVGPHANHVEKQQCHGAHYETGHAARQTQAHHQGHKGLQDERNGHRGHAPRRDFDPCLDCSMAESIMKLI